MTRSVAGLFFEFSRAFLIVTFLIWAYKKYTLRLSKRRLTEADPIFGFSLKRVAMIVGGFLFVFIFVIASIALVFALREYWRGSP